MNRRQFLSTTSATLAAGALLPRTTLSAQDFQKADGASYAPTGKPNPVVKAGEFVVAAAHFDHGHINGMINGLTEAGATLKWIYEPDASKTAAMRAKFPSAKIARSLAEILDDKEVKLVASAAVTSERGPLGCKIMEAGKDYFTDKAPFTTMAQLDQAKAVVAKTGRKYFVYYGERLHNEAAMFATDLLQQGVIGRVLQVVNLAPHRLSLMSRPDWFWVREKFGGILCDIGSHQFEQFLAYSGAKDATILNATIANYGNPTHPEFEDFGDANLLGDNGSTQYVRVDWFTPDGLSTWGDGRTFVLGTKGTIELRKYVDIAREKTGDHVYLFDGKGEQHIACAGKVGFRFFGEFILDCLNRTEKAMTQAHAFKAAELSLKAQAVARRLT
jgi:predicted dehydrogenase